MPVIYVLLCPLCKGEHPLAACPRRRNYRVKE